MSFEVEYCLTVNSVNCHLRVFRRVLFRLLDRVSTISFNLLCYFMYVLHEFCTLYLFMLLAIGLNKLFLIPDS